MKIEKPEGPVVLCILDGFGDAPAGDDNAIAQARTPNYDRMLAENATRGWCMLCAFFWCDFVLFFCFGSVGELSFGPSAE